MKKFEALFGGKKGKEDDKISSSPEQEKGKNNKLKKATELKNEISGIAKEKSFESLELSDLKKVLAKYRQIESILGISSKEIFGSAREQMDMAKKVMGEEFFGFQEVEKAFGISVSPEDIPELQFGRVELERAKELGQFLILRVDKAKDGDPLSLQKINAILKGKISDGSKLLYSDDGAGKIQDDAWYKDEDFIKTETPKLGWALVSKEVIPNSTDKNYLNQTEELVNYLRGQVFKEKAMPKKYQEGIREFEKEKKDITNLMSSDWKKASERLSRLKINQMTRQNPAEALYDIAIYFQNKKERILENKYTWTNCRDSDGELVSVGRFASDGADVHGDTPDASDGWLGVAFSRSL